MPVTLLGTGDTVVNKSMVLSLNGAYILVEAIHKPEIDILSDSDKNYEKNKISQSKETENDWRDSYFR